MTRLDLAITDFALPIESDSVPRLALLERLLARGRQRPSRAASWRHWLLERCGMDPPGELPLGRWLAGREGAFALATPLHLVAGLEHVHLDPAGPLRLEPAAWQVLVETFNAEFGQDGLRLHHRDGLGLLSLPRPVEVTTHDPGSLPGCDAGGWLPGGRDGGWLRGTMTAIQMWLHDHPLNRQRASAGLVPANALWIWGAGCASLPPPDGALPALATDDDVSRRLWRHLGGAGAELPTSFAAWPGDGSPRRVVALSLAGLDADPRRALAELESRWLGPVAADVLAGRLGGACLHLGGTELEFARGDLLRFWRRPRAWHEALR